MSGFTRRLGALMVAATLVAAACGSSGATTNANPTTGIAGSGSPTSGVATNVVPTPNATLGANDILTSAITKSGDITSMHLAIAVSGTLNESVLSAAMSSGAPAPKASAAPLKLDGTTVSGDIDVTNKALDLKVAAPAFAATGEVIVVGGNAYYQLSLLTGTKFKMIPLSGANLPLPSVAPSALASLSLSDALSQLQSQVAAAGITVDLVGTETIAGAAAQHFRVNLPLDKINARLATQGGGLSLTSANLDFWLYTADLRLAQIVMAADAGTAGNLSVTITLSAYNTPVTISAPPASSIQTTP